MSVRINNKLVASNARQINSDWNATTGGAAILNKPTNLVHTSGNETIGGQKTFTSSIVFDSISYSGGAGFIYQQASAGQLSIGLYSSGTNWSQNWLQFEQSGATNIHATTNIALSGSTPATTNISPTEDTTTSTQIDTVGARNTKLANYSLDNNTVHKTGDETITGTKTFTSTSGIRVKGDDDFVNVTESKADGILRTYDSANKPVGSLHNFREYNATSGKSKTGLWLRGHNITNSDSYGDLRNMVSDEGNAYILYYTNNATNLNLTNSTNSTTNTYLATMGWVNNPSTSTNVVHRSGSETISGLKIFSNTIVSNNSDIWPIKIQDENININSNPSSNSSKMIIFTDENDNVVSRVTSTKSTNGDQALSLYVTTKVGDVLNFGELSIKATSSGSIVTSAPTPTAGDNSTKIATTAFVKTAIDNEDNNVVHKTGDETIAGTKTFSNYIKTSIQSWHDGVDQHIEFIDKDGGPDNNGKGCYIATEDGISGSWNKVVTEQGTNNFVGSNTFTQTIQGTAYRALYADLAEYYEMDMKYPTGTLVQFGGLNEMTIASTEVNAVISENPAFIMNGKETDNSQPVALIGKVKIRVEGKVNKFDKLTLSENPGIAKVSTNDNDVIIGRALESKDFEEESLVLSSVKIKLG